MLNEQTAKIKLRKKTARRESAERFRGSSYLAIVNDARS